MSTYSSNLRLELITTGTQAGTWGTTTNTNIGTLIEGSIAGMATVTVLSAAQAFTANNGAADEARNANIQLTTSGVSTPFAVYAPPATKQYVIFNNSSYVATIYNSTVLGNTTAAGTGVSIPAGTTMTVWSNGTSFYQQNTYFNTPVLNAPAISGVSSAPTAAFGNSTSQLATTAFVQAALQALYPVGSIYSSTASTNPGTTFGFGTWNQFAAGEVLVGAGGAYAAGSTGGSADAVVVAHTHTASSSFTGSALAGHSHTATDSGHTHTIGYTGNLGYSGGGGNANTFWGSGSNQGTNSGNANISVSSVSAGTPAGSVATTVDSAGVSGANANLQPYVVVYIWTRTA